MNRAESLNDAWNRLLSGESYVIACHQRPDGDTLGSALAIAHALRREGKEVVVLSQDGVPENYEFIPESDTVAVSTESGQFDVGLLVDCEGLSRAGSAAAAVESARLHACIDHHVPEDGFGEVRVVDEHASSTAEVVVELLDANDVQIDQTMASQLLTGLIADTGAFRFANTSPQTFHIAARLTDLGAKPSVIAREVYDNHPVRALQLLGRALCSLETDTDGSVVWASITRSDLEELGANDADTDGIVNQVARVKGPKVAILFREIEPESIRVSLRSRDGVDVNEIARAFGGGGHVGAAGCTVGAPLAQAREQVIGEVLKWMAS